MKDETSTNRPPGMGNAGGLSYAGKSGDGISKSFLLSLSRIKKVK